MKWFIFIIVGLFWLTPVSTAFSQCGAIDFTLPVKVCQNERILITPDQSNGIYDWDFCSGDLDNNPSAVAGFQVANVAGRPGMELVRKENIWFGFITGTWANSLQLLEFGNGLDQDPTGITDLGDLNGMLNGPGQIRMINQDGMWYGIIHNTGTSEILKLIFGNQFSEVISVTVLTTGVGYSNSGLAIGNDPVEGWIGLISEPDNTFSIIRFGNDLHPSTPDDIIVTPAVPNPNNLGDVDLVNICGEWFGAAINFGGGNTFLLDFGQNLFSIPQVDQIASLAINNGARLRFAQEGEAYFLLIASLDGIWHKLKFGTALHLNPVVIDEGNMEGSLQANTYGLAVVKENSVWTIFTVSQTNGQVFRINYPQNCSASQSSSIEWSPIVTYESEGGYTVSLNFFSEGMWFTKSKSITVLPQVAPDIRILSENMCAANDVFFTPLNLSGGITTYNWNFGDLTTSSNASNPTHQYATEGPFEVNLQVIAANGCNNYASKNISIYPEPVSSFTVHPGLLCTNSEIDFLNTTNDTHEGNLSYQWFIDENPISTERDLQHTFTTTGPKTIKLITSIPGCSNEITKTTSPIQPGPIVDFTFSGTCEEETFHFQNEISETVDSYSWDFNDGQTSADPNPTNNFSEAGDYAVSLTVTNAIGCQNHQTEVITVQAKPSVDFQVSGPPNSCSGTETQFINQSNSNDGSEIMTWLWDFDDNNNPTTQTSENPQHIFRDPGVYSVSLFASTEFGCVATLEKDITITQSPSTDFTFTSACDDLPVIFSGPTGSDIDFWYWEIGTAYYTTSSTAHTFRTSGEYAVSLEVGSSNGCFALVTSMIHVPQPLMPDFSVFKNCIGHQTVFTDITSGADPVTARTWDFDGMGTSTSATPIHTFHEAGDKTIHLEVTGQSGCTYQVSKDVSIGLPPVAGFTADPSSGGTPLEVLFRNTSTLATQYLWQFSDGTGSTSSETSPVYTFYDVGDFEVELTAMNTRQCEDTFRAAVSTVAPLPDVDLEVISLSANTDGSFKLIVTINNKGNTVLKNLPVDLDFSGTVKLRETVQEPIFPASKYNLVLSTGIINPESLRYVCASVDLFGDLVPQGNRICKEFKHTLFVFPVYPNPAKEILQLEWITDEDKTVHIFLSDAMGRNVLSADRMSKPGLNQALIDVSRLQNGIYQLVLMDGATKAMQRVLISGKP